MAERDEKGTSSIRMRLACRTCGNDIPVLVRAEGSDAKAIAAAVEGKEDYALLDRFCPFCMERRLFALPMARSGTAGDTRAPIQESISLKSFTPMAFTPQGPRETPKARAARLFREGVSHKKNGEDALAESAFRESADIFERVRLFRECADATR